jgi:hypothetical protein
MATIIIFGVALIIFGLVKNATNRQRERMGPSPRAQRLLQKMQAQQAANQQPRQQGQQQYGQPGQPFPAPGGQPSGRAQAGAQIAGMLQQFLQTGQQQAGYTPPGQYQPAQYAQPQHQQPQRGQAPPKKGEVEKKVRELMAAGQEVAAIRMLSDEQDMGIIEAQKYARGLVAPPGQSRSDRSESSGSSGSSGSSDGSGGSGGSAGAERPVADEPETRYVGSAAFSESLFDLDRDENVWASGWVDKPEPDDRSDIDELWQTVKNAGRPPA